MVKFLNSINPDLIDGVVSGHTHSIVHNFINGIPVIQGKNNMLYFNLIHFSFDTETKRIDKDETTIEGPIPVCDKIYDIEKICDLPLGIIS